ncbi:MAG: LytTR family transcriptional regulator DNA-binding domain-containing protein [Reichenbachiella sp.]|uniref:LytTR family DNA-binding domain-containing protein n=1 Tax=Reichenbachiella sp. TaxID=2184521 RepID=UPI0032988FF5
MIERLDFNFLRNPIWILTAFVAILLPDFVVACQFEFAGSLAFFASDTLACTNGLASDIFIGHSVLSFFMVVVVFEIFRLLRKPLRLEKVPRTLRSFAGYEIKTVIGLVLGILIYAVVTGFILKAAEVDPTDNFIHSEFTWFEFNRALIVGFVLINSQLLYTVHLNKKRAFNIYIKAEGPFGMISLELDAVDWFEKEGRHYYAYADGSKYKISLHLQALEKRLDMNKFIRINRAVIINSRIVQDYSHWENEKYILRSKKDREFVVSRKRIKLLKEILNSSDALTS